MKTLDLKLSVRLDNREALRLSTLADAHGLSQAELLRTLVKWLPAETVTELVNRSKGFTGGAR